MEWKKIVSILVFTFFITFYISALEKYEIVWRFPTGGKIQTPPVEGSDGTIYFCSEDRFLYALNVNGTLKWRTKFNDRLTETLAIGIDGSIYIGSKKGLLFAVNQYGVRLWTRNLKGAPFGSPAIAPDGSLFLVTKNGWMYSISHSGYVRWEIKLPSKPVLAPVLGIDIYIALDNERVYSYNRVGNNIWTFLLSGQAASIALSEKSIYVGTNNSTLVSVDYSGKRIWNQSLSGVTASVLVLTNDRILSASGKNLIMMDSSGKILFTKIMRQRLTDLSVIADAIVCIDIEGSIYWIKLDGTPVSILSEGISGGRLLLVSDGSVYVGGRDWLFYKYAFRNLLLSNDNDFVWHSFRSDNGNRGYLLSGIKTKQQSVKSTASDFVYLNEMIKSLDEKVLNNILDEIESRLVNRSYDPGKLYLLDILKLLASEGIEHPILEDGVLVNNFPLIRSRAADLLGIAGNLTTIDFLADLLFFEWDSYAANSIIKALGNLQSDWNNKNSKAIIKYYRLNSNNMNERTLSQVLISIRKIDMYKRSGNRDLLSVVMDILLTSSSKTVKELALDTINSIKK